MALKRCVVCNWPTSHTVTVRFPPSVTRDAFVIPICAIECAPGWSTALARDTNPAPAEASSLAHYLGALDGFFG